MVLLARLLGRRCSDAVSRGPHPAFVGWGPLSRCGSVSVPRLVWRGIVDYCVIWFNSVGEIQQPNRYLANVKIRAPTHRLDNRATVIKLSSANLTTGLCHRAQLNPHHSMRVVGVFCVPEN